MPAIIFLFFLSSAFAGDFFIKSLKAPILKEAKNGSSVVGNVDRGTRVDGVKPEGSFVLVKYNGNEGYINKLFLSDRPVEGKTSLLNQEVDISSKARKRASGFTSAAAARGLKEDSDSIFKTLGTQVNPEEFKKLESFLVSDKAGLDFIQNEKSEIKQ